MIMDEWFKIEHNMLTFMFELIIFSNSSGVIFGTEYTKSSNFRPTALFGFSLPERTSSTYEMTASSICSSLPVPSEIRAKSGIGSTCLILANLVLCNKSRPVTSGSLAVISTGIGVNIDPEVAPGTPIGTLERIKEQSLYDSTDVFQTHFKRIIRYLYCKDGNWSN